MLLLCFYTVSGDGIDFTDIYGNSSGQTVLNFLTIPVSATQLGRGITAQPGSMDATDIPLASSATAFFSQYKFALTHLEWLMGLRKEYVGACFPLLDQGTIGFYSQVFSLGDFDYARDIDEYVSDPSAVELAVGASYARQIIPGIAGVGVVASYIESRLAGDNGRAFNCAFDATVKPLLWLSAQAYARNIGTKVTYNQTSEQQPFQTGLSLLFSPARSEDTAFTNGFGISFGLGAQKTIDAPLQFGICTDIRPVKPFSIRAGYEYPLGYDFTLGGLSAGIGLNVKQYGIDAGWKYQSDDFGSVWALSIRYDTDEMIPRTATDFYNVARRNFSRGRYNTCILYAKKALRLNPNMWQAHSLITKAVAEIHQKQGTEILLIYTGNTQGQFLPLAVNETTMGGLARQAAVIKKLRKEYPLSLTIDAGNIITQYTSPVKAKFADTYYQQLQYDAVALGTGEAAFGFKKYCTEIKQSPMKFICTNCSEKAGGDFIDKKIITLGDYRIAILNMIPASKSLRSKKDTTLLARTMDVVRYTQSKKIKQCNLRILIVNDSWETVQHYAKNAPLVDIIICGGLRQHFEVPMKIGSIPAVSTGEFGKYAGALELRFNDSRKLLSYNNRLIPLTSEIKPDPAIDLLAHQLTLKSDLEGQGLTKQKLKKSKSEGLLTFISDRRGGAQVYLKVMSNKIEFPLTFGDSRCFQPVVSFKNGAILYLFENDTLNRRALMNMDITGENKRVVKFDGHVSEVAFTTDENWIYASVAAKKGAQSDIVRILSAGGEPQPVIDWKDGSEQEFSFSTDGINMLFISDRDGSRQVYISDIAGATPVRITEDQSNCFRPKFCPLDKYIAYLSDKNNFKDKKDLWVLDKNNGDKLRITSNAGVFDYCWLDDKGTILYSSGANLTDLNTINILTGENKKFIITGQTKDYSENHPSITMYKNMPRILYQREYVNGQKKLFMVDCDGTGDQQVTIDEGNCWVE